MATFKVTLDKRYKAKNEKYPVCIKLLHKQRYVFIKLGYTIQEEYFKELENGSAMILKNPDLKGIIRVNNIINAKFFELTELIEVLTNKKKIDHQSVYELKRLFENEKENIYFDIYLKKHMENIRNASTQNGYRSAYNYLLTQMPGEHIEFESLDANFLNKMINSWLAKGRSPNGLKVYFKYFKAAFNAAIKDNSTSATRDNYQLDNVVLKTITPPKRALPSDQLTLLQNYSTSDEHKNIAIKLFMFSYFMAGANFRDLALLTKANIINNRLIYIRSKTNHPFNFKIHEKPLNILSEFNNPKSKYLFPIINKVCETDADLIRHINDRNGLINKHLNDIATELDLNVNLTFYVARHSFATKAKRNDMQVTKISEALGHTSLKTTQIYLDSLEDSALDEMIELLSH